MFGANRLRSCDVVFILPVLAEGGGPVEGASSIRGWSEGERLFPRSGMPLVSVE